MGSTSALVENEVVASLVVEPVGVGMMGSMVEELLGMTGTEYAGLV
jgi:hypothetical protein